MVMMIKGQPLSVSETGFDRSGGGDQLVDSDLQRLLEVFSGLSLGRIISAYEEAHGDSNKAADLLIEEAEAEAAVVGSKSHRKKRQKKKKNRKGGGVSSTGTVSCVLGKDYYVKNQKHNQLSLDQGGREEAEEFLRSMMMVPPAEEGYQLDAGVIGNVFRQCGYNIEKALDVLLDVSTACYNQFRNDESIDHICDGNHDIKKIDDGYRNDHARSIIQKFKLTGETSDLTSHLIKNEVDNNQGNVECAYRTYAKVVAGLKEHLPSRLRATNLNPQQMVLESLFSVPVNSERTPSSMNWKKAVEKVESFGKGLEFRPSGITEPQHYGKHEDYQILRTAARQQWDTMKSYYQKAAVAFSRGEHGQASYFSEQGKFHRKLAHEADEKASREIFESSNSIAKGDYGLWFPWSWKANIEAIGHQACEDGRD
ncbi:hypothetical protein QJS10_CPB11g00001 [Acorus calamus]|uniref:DUF1771 domain-containing protein n=1 Tax=Acorus calamus TaxID=4465 RepID=A0AAV9DRN0_ACOCL|nr:hypothetical protein QJS10_CPB11g00001 [Acorus calamus]